MPDLVSSSDGNDLGDIHDLGYGDEDDDYPGFGQPLSPIQEGNEDDLITQAFYEELISETPLSDAETPLAEVPPHPIYTMPEQIVYIATGDGEMHMQEWYPEDIKDQSQTLIAQPTSTTPSDSTTTDDYMDEDDIGKYVEICYTDNMAPVILEEGQVVHEGEVATARLLQVSRADAERFY